MKNWFKNLFLSNEETEDEQLNQQDDPLEEVLYKKRQRIKEPREKTITTETTREDFIEVKKRSTLNEDIIHTLQQNGIEIEKETSSKIRQLSQRSQQLSEEVEQLGETVYKRHRSTRERSKISVQNLNEDMKKISPSKQSQRDDIFGIFPEEPAEDIVVEIADEYLEQVTSVEPQEEILAPPVTESQQVADTYTKLTQPRKSFMEEFGPKSDDEVPYYPQYKGKQASAPKDPHHAYQYVHKAGFKPTTHFSAIHGLGNTEQATSSTVTRSKKSLSDVEYSSTGRIIRSKKVTPATPKINGVDEPKTIAGLKQVEIKSPSSSHIHTSAISVSAAKQEAEPQPTVKEEASTTPPTPYNVLSSVEERARLRKLKRLGR